MLYVIGFAKRYTFCISAYKVVTSFSGKVIFCATVLPNIVGLCMENCWRNNYKVMKFQGSKIWSNFVCEKVQIWSHTWPDLCRGVL